HLTAPLYCSQSNGLVERYNASPIASLMKRVFEYPTQWDRFLPMIVLSINAFVHASMIVSPLYLVQAFEPKLPSEHLLILLLPPYPTSATSSREVQFVSTDDVREEA